MRGRMSILRSVCGWCGTAVHWPSEGESHYKGVCVDPTLALWESRQKPGKTPRPSVPLPLDEISYLRGRLSQVYDTPSAKRPRWTLTDVESVRKLLLALQLQRRP